jgi:hypothetical protein
MQESSVLPGTSGFRYDSACELHFEFMPEMNTVAATSIRMER